MGSDQAEWVTGSDVDRHRAVEVAMVGLPSLLLSRAVPRQYGSLSLRECVRQDFRQKNQQD